MDDRHKIEIQSPSPLANAGSPFFLSLKRIVPGAVFFTALLSTTLVFRHLDIWNEMFFEAGPQILVYNLMRIILTAFLLLSCYCTGLIAPFSRLRGLDHFLAASYTGFGILSLSGFVLGMAGLLHPVSSFIILTFPYFLLARRLSTVRAWKMDLRPSWKKMHWIPLAGLAALGLSLFVLRALPPEIMTNDFAHYLPLFQHFAESGNLWPNQYWLTYYYTKGAGLTVLLTSISDVQAVHLVNTCSILLLCLAVYRLATLISNNNKYLPIAAVLYLLSTPFLYTEFVKIHVQVASLVIGLAYFFSLQYIVRRGSRPAWIMGARIVLAALVVLSPPIMAFIGPLLLGNWLFALYLKRPAAAKCAFNTGLIGAAAFTGVLLVNYWTTGLFEVTPLRFFFEYRNEEILKSWTDPAGFMMQMAFNYGQSAFVMPDINLSNLAIYILVPIALGAFLYRFKKKHPIFVVRLIVLTTPLLVVIAGYMVMKQFVTQFGSLDRYTVFIYPMKAVIFSGGATVFCQLLYQYVIKKYFLTKKVSISKMITVFALLALLITPFQLNKTLRPWLQGNRGAYLDFFFGKRSLSTMYGRFYCDICIRMARAFPREMQILPLNFLPGAYILPNVHFQRPLFNDFHTELGTALFGTAEEAASVYRKYKIRHFLVFFNSPLLFQGYSALFQPYSIPRYFKVRHFAENAWLLTLDGTQKDGQTPGPEFLKSYYRTQALCQKDGYANAAYRAMRMVNQELRQQRPAPNSP